MTEIFFDDGTLRRLGVSARGASSPVELVLRRGGLPDVLTRGLAAAANEVARGTGGAVPYLEEGGEQRRPSGLAVRCRGRDVARYLAVPAGPEAAPFLDLLLAVAGSPSPVSEPVRPHLMEVLVAAACPNCPHTVAAAGAVAAGHAGLTVEVVDVALLPERAEAYAVRAVPTVVVDGGLTVVGGTSRDGLESALRRLDGPDADAAVLGSLVDAGRFDAAAARLGTSAGRRAYASLWNASAMQGRIGLLLAVEPVLNADPRGLDELVALVAPALRGDDPARRGDTADLLSRIGSTTALPMLEACVGDPDPDVAEAVDDAVAALRG